MTNTRSRILSTLPVILLLVVQTTFVQASSFPQTTTAQSSAKVAQFLKQSGYTYKQAAETVWVVKMNGVELKEYEALVATNEGIVVIGVVMANRKALKSSDDLLFKLLKLNHEKDFMKIGFDNDDDLFIRTEHKVRNLDLDEFKSLVEQVKAATDMLYTEIKPSLIK
jgi:hypothetical protein